MCAQSFDPRQTMRRNDFEIFHYKNSELPNVAVHHHDFYEVYLFLGGSVEYRVEGQIFRLQRGDVLLINPMELHQVSVESDGQPYERIVLWIEPDYLARHGSELTRCFDPSLPTHVNLLRPAPQQQAQLLGMMDALVRERYTQEYAAGAYATGLFLQVMAELNRLALHADVLPETAASTELIANVLQLVSRNYADELLLDDIASRFYVSKYHLSHEFTRQVGTSLHKYVTLKRLQIARQMLTDGEAPGEVSARCGFGDYANFYRAFRAQYGMTPKSCAARRERG